LDFFQKDKITLENNPTLSWNQDIVEAVRILPPNQGIFDVVFGLAFDSISMKGAVSPFTNNIAESGILKENKISLYLGKYSEENGEIIFGNDLSQHPSFDNNKNKIIWHPILSEFFWILKINKIDVKNNDKDIKNNDILMGIVDTGTSFIIMNKELIHSLLKNGRIKTIEKEGLYIVPHCNKNIFPDIIITIENQSYVLSKNDYLFQNDIKNVCILGFMSLDHDNKKILSIEI